MSFVIWYQVEISAPDAPGGFGLPLAVSNDVLSGSFILDADIRVRMTEGAATDTFEISLSNLPASVTDAIRAARAVAPVQVEVRLGYFDEPATRTGDGGLVLSGRLTRLAATVGADGYARTLLYGQETAGYLLRLAKAAVDLPDKKTALDFAQALADNAKVELVTGSTLPGDLDDYTVRTGSALGALGALAKRGDVPLVVRDGKILLGAAVGAPGDNAPIVLDPDTNIVSLGNLDGEDTGGDQEPPVRNAVNLTILGHPRLRVGQVATVRGLTGLPTGPLRLSRVEHHFTTGGGYTTEVDLIAAGSGQRAEVNGGVQVVADRWQGMVDRAHDDRPAIDVGEVTSYAEGRHTASLHYGQSPDPGVNAPSVASPVDPDLNLRQKPIASPFAFDRTGLVTPVYPRMRALLAHNRSTVNDAVVAGFLWLALPTGLDDDGLPTGPGANDLIDAAGRRAVHATGLHILVGTDALPEVGTRPDPPDDNTITIEHQSGTTIAIDAGGAVSITTSNQPITMTNGSVSLKLDGPTVAVS
jgi:hypothetical protein